MEVDHAEKLSLRDAALTVTWMFVGLTVKIEV